MKQKYNLRNQKGFTLIEIIAVLIILGILAAVAAPKFISLGDDAKRSSAKGVIDRVKTSLDLGYGKAYASWQRPPSLVSVRAAAALAAGNQTIGDCYINIADISTTAISIQVLSVNKADVGLAVASPGTWSTPLEQ